MKLKNFYFVVLVIAFVLSSTGCELKASFPPMSKTTPTANLGDFPAGIVPGATEIGNLATQMVDVAKEAGTVVPQPKDGIGAEGDTATPVPTATFTPLPTNTPAPATATPAVPATYNLQKGEWPICIARRYNLDLDALFALNNINMHTNIVPVGFQLKLPATGNWTDRYGTRYWHPHPATFTVRPDDNIYTVACFFGDVTPKQIEDANGLDGSYTLSVGQKLSIP